MSKNSSLHALLVAEGKEKTALCKEISKEETSGSLKGDVKNLNTKQLRQLKSMKFSAQAQKELDEVYSEMAEKKEEKKAAKSSNRTQERNGRY